MIVWRSVNLKRKICSVLCHNDWFLCVGGSKTSVLDYDYNDDNVLCGYFV